MPAARLPIAPFLTAGNCGGWQIDDERRTTAGCVFDGDAPAHGLGEAARDGETEPDALASGMAVAQTLERGEDLVPILFLDPGSPVDHTQLDAAGVAAAGDADVGIAGRIAQGVLDQVGDHPLEQGRIGQRFRQVGWDVEIEMAARRHVVERPRDDVVEPDRHRRTSAARRPAAARDRAGR